MKAKDAMFVWIPNRDEFAARPGAGQIITTKVSEAAQFDRLPCSAGACDAEWRDADPVQRHDLMQKWIRYWLFEEKLSRDAIWAAVTTVNEYRQFPFSFDDG